MTIRRIDARIVESVHTLVIIVQRLHNEFSTLRPPTGKFAVRSPPAHHKKSPRPPITTASLDDRGWPSLKVTLCSSSRLMPGGTPA